MKQFTKRVLAFALAFVMVFSCVSGVQPLTVNAAAKKYVKSMKVSSKVSVTAGSKKTVKVTIKVSGKASKKVKVKTSNKKIAKVSYSAKKSKITIKGVKAGKAKVTVTSVGKNKKGKKIKKTIKVTVTKKKSNNNNTTEAATTQAKILVTSVKVSESSAAMLKGTTRQLFATVAPDNANDKSITWKSSAANVASVDANGLVKAVSAGTAVITASNSASGKSGSCTITVSDEAVVTSQSELENALSSSTVGVIKIKTGSNITISSGNYTGRKLEVQTTGGAVVTNNADFDNVTVSGGAYNENANNKILVTAQSKVTVSDKSSSDIIVALSGNNASSKVELVNNGTITDLSIQSAGTVSISGKSTSDLPIPVSISSANVTLKSEQNVAVNATAKANLVLTGDTDKTTVIVDKEANLPSISGVGFIPYKVTDTNKEGTISADPSDDMAPLDITGLVKDAYANKVLSDVDIYLIPYKEYSKGMTLPSDKAVATKTDSEGKYKFSQAKSGNYYMVMKKTGYKDAIQLITASSRFNTTYENEVMELLDSSKSDSTTASVSGIAKDATNGKGIAGITVELRNNKGNIIDSTDITIVTDNDGSYSFTGLEADQYTLYFKDNRETDDEKYIALLKNVCVKADTAESTDVTLSKPVKGKGVRFVLTWGSKAESVPKDLDSHLFVPMLDGGYKEISYESMYYAVGNQIYSMLDVDDMYYDGPETSTILNATNGIYYYYVHNYSGNDEGCNLTTSQAHVDVYSSNQLLTSYNVPSSSNVDGRVWKVCSYNPSTGAIISYNEILEWYDIADEDIGSEITNYIYNITSSSWSIDYDVVNYDEVYNTDAARVGLTITGNADEWSQVKDTITVTLIDDYTCKMEASTVDGVDAILNIFKDGVKIGYYYVYYQPAVKITINGVNSYRFVGGSAIIQTNSDIIDVTSLSCTCSDSTHTARIEYDENSGEFRLNLYNSNNKVIYYYKVIYYADCITGIACSYMSEYVIYNPYVYVVYKDEYTGVRNWSDVKFTIPDGYTYKLADEGSNKIIQIIDSQGRVITKNNLYWVSESEYDEDY